MELRQLRCFLALANTLNFSRASESLYLSQSSLSRYIADLEKELNISLFERDKRNVRITAAGAALVDEAKKILTATDEIPALVRSAEADENGPHSVLVGADSIATADPGFRKFLTQALYTLTKTNPNVRTDFRQQEFHELQSALLAGTLDLAFLLDNPSSFDERFDTRTFWTEEMVLAVRSPFAYSQKDLPQLIEDWGLLLLERENRGLAQIMRILDDLGVRTDIRFCKNRESLTLSLECGMSAAILPMSVLSKLENLDLQIFHLPSDSVKLHLFAAWPHDAVNPQRDELLGYVERYTAAFRS